MNKLTYMSSFHLNKTMFFVLVAALLSTQWSSTHIHLAEQHDHDGIQHQHNIESHAHQSFSHDDIFSDSIHQVNQQELKLVELGYECNVQSWNNIDDLPIILSYVNLQLIFTHHINKIKSAGFGNSKRRYIDYSTINLRAPPKFS